jgi:hypothetical protein
MKLNIKNTTLLSIITILNVLKGMAAFLSFSNLKLGLKCNYNFCFNFKPIVTNMNMH